MSKSIPFPTPQAGLNALKAMLREHHPLAALQVFHDELGDVFRINLPGFTPVVMVGPQAAHFVLVQERSQLRWRNETDPVTQLLGHGVLVEDGDEHDRLRRLLNPPLHRRMLEGYALEIWQHAAQVCGTWLDNKTLDMLGEMRKIALLNLMHTLFRVDYTPHLLPLWQVVLDCIKFISPGIWMIWKNAPRPGYLSAIQRMDEYLFRIIAERRSLIPPESELPTDILGLLIVSGMHDRLIRDQLLTMLIAGHDTVTALMAWTFYLLGQHPDALQRVQAQLGSLDAVQPPSLEQINQLTYLDWVIKEALRLYPPIHLGSRLAAVDLDFNGWRIPAGERVIYSIYLTQRHKAYWDDPHQFIPERHAGNKPAPYTYLAFGGGPRNCIGAAFGQMEAKIVLAYVLRHFTLHWMGRKVTPYMGATLEPHPGVFYRLHRCG